MAHDLAVTALDSPLWPRVAALAPRLRTGVHVRYRREGAALRALLVDPRNGRHHLVDPAAWRVIGLFDGQRDLAQIWRALHSARPTRRPQAGPLPSQQEVIDCLVALDQAGLLLCDQAPDIAAVIQGQDRAERLRRQAAAHPLAWRLPLPDPSAVLARLGGVGRVLLHPASALLAALLVLAALLQGGQQAGALQAALHERLAQAHFLVLCWGLYPLVKGLHELGHALAVRHYGGAVHHVGIAFLYLIPAPYVDASAAAGFASRRQRLVVSAIGLVLEGVLAAAGLLVWSLVQPGLVRDAALALTLVGGVSTLLANANPLVRMDGYHLLVDALDLPNLAARSRRYSLDRLQRLLLGPDRLPAAMRPPRRRERLLLPLYAPAAWAFGLVAGLLAARWLAEMAPLLGAVVAALTLWSQVLRPLGRALGWLLGETPGPARTRALGWSATAALGGLLLLSLPLPHTETAFGVVRAPEEAAVRAPADGPVRQVLHGDRQAVAADAPLLEVVDDQLPLALARTRSQRLEQDTLAHDLQWRDPARAQRATIEADRLAREEATLQARLERLRLPAPRAGTLYWLDPATLEGRWVRRGELLGQVLAPGDRHAVRVALPAAQLPALDAVRGLRVQAPDLAARPQEARWSGRAEAPGYQLPAAALGQTAGGPIETDPADPDGLRTLAPVVVLDVEVPGVEPRWIGQRVAVHLDLAPAALAPRLWRSLQRLLLRHLGADVRATPAEAP